MTIVGASLCLSLLAKMSFSSSYGRYHPQIPNFQTGEIVEFQAIHNRVVYVTRSEKQWADIADLTLCISIGASFVLAIAYRSKW
jgi:hypothetical protein